MGQRKHLKAEERKNDGSFKKLRARRCFRV